MAEKVSGSKLWINLVVKFSLFPVFFLAPSGDWFWPEAWLITFLYLSWALLIGLWLNKHNPSLLKERLKGPIQKGQKGWDKVLMGLMFVFGIALVLVPGLDHRWALSSVPLWLKALAFLGHVPAMFLTFLVMRENTFLSRIVKLQKRQKVVSTGPYRWVRHPLYSAAVMMYVFLPLALDSFVALAFAVPSILLIALRAKKEEDVLRRELEGYEEYAEKTRYRFFPGIW